MTEPRDPIKRRRVNWPRVAVWILLALVIAHLAISVVVHAQIDRALELGDKVSALETRTAVLENEMSEVVWLGRGVVLALIGQIVVLLLRTDRRNRPRGGVDSSDVAAWLRRSPGGDE